MSTSDIKPDILISSHDESPSAGTPFSFYQDQEEEFEIADRKDTSSVWALKIPRFLLERWEMVEEAGVELGSLVVDNSTTPARITLKLTHPDDKPSSPSEASSQAKRIRYDISVIPDEYNVNVPEERAKNLYVFTEKKKVYGPSTTSGTAEGDDVPKVGGKRKRDKARPKLLAKVDHECHVTPVQTQKYLKILEQRRLESEQSKRPVMRMDDTGISQAEQNQLASGYKNSISTFGSRMISSGKQNTGERHARLERHELTDRIFSLFKEKPYWGIPALKMTLKQPDSWLREVLKDVAEQIKEGRYVNMWQLKKSWRDGEGEGDTEIGAEGESDVKGEGDEVGEGFDQKPIINEDDLDEDEDEDDDFEEVLA
ncbi:uncharacterized protein IL334_006927 [Kwoniella shivajii]|uniref:Transcription initiation factor IIF subunit beta n=1 Tax=Kwoniella shivajii TaxID=564305 RepID=A0ABZ1DAE5_9TREE|nr:hypothetical protein IL334_006927 [Kwoniella shivajii]